MSDTGGGDRAFFQASWGRLGQIVEQFENAWQSGQKPAIDEYLKTGDVEPGKLLVELAHADLECRFKAGEPARVEIYFQRFAELAADRRAALGLIAAEYDLRRRREPGLKLDEYLQRFPEFRADLPERLPGPHQRSAHPTASTSAQCVGQFELLDTVGQGAFGTVYRARDLELDRIVAVKLPRGDRSITPADAERFVREARSAAQLTHPGIVPVYEVGHDAAVPYIVSAFVEGQTLAEIMAAQRLDFRQAADVVAQVAEALDHAHQQGVVHRDLKPSNIMLGRVQGSGVRGQESGVRSQESGVKSQESGKSDTCPLTPDPCSLTPGQRAFVMDFGLARRDDEIRLTVEGLILGTPAYMSPEQASGQSHRVDGRSDIYSLGVILYELLTGELPFRGVARMVLQQILSDEPRPPRRLNDRIPRDLETIALKCMSKEPGGRFPSAAALAADLRRHLKGEPILARPIGRVERTWRWAKRNPWVAGLSAAVALLLATGTIGSLLAAIHIRGQRDEIGVERDAAVSAREHAVESAEAARQHLNLTLETLGKLVGQVQDKLRDQPALNDLREQLLQEALTGLKQVNDVTKSGAADPRMALAHEQLGDIFLKLGRAAEAKEQYLLCRAAVERAADDDPDRARLERARCVSAAKLGEVSLRLNDVKAAQAYCDQAVSLAEALAQAAPESVEAAHDLAMCYFRLGLVNKERGDLRAAVASFRRAAQQGDKVVAGWPRNMGVLSDAVNFYQRLGDAYLAMRNLKEARRANDKGAELAQTRVDNQPESASAKLDLSWSFDRIGEIAMLTNEAPAALKAFRQVVALREELAADAPKNTHIQSDLAVGYGNLGAAYERQGDRKEAREYFSKALDRFEALATAFPSDAQIQRNRAIGYQRLGVADKNLGETDKAVALCRKALEEFEKLALADPENIERQFEWVSGYGALGRVAEAANDFAQALQCFERGVALLQKLEAAGRLANQPRYNSWLQLQRKAMEQCRLILRAIDDLDFALRQPPDVAEGLLVKRAAALASKGQHAQAAATAEKLRQVGRDHVLTQYKVACCYALCARAVGRDKPANRLTSEDRASREGYAAQAIAALSAAVEGGFKNDKKLETDPDLVSIRPSPEFQALAKRLKEGR